MSDSSTFSSTSIASLIKEQLSQSLRSKITGADEVNSQYEGLRGNSGFDSYRVRSFDIEEADIDNYMSYLSEIYGFDIKNIKNDFIVGGIEENFYSALVELKKYFNDNDNNFIELLTSLGKSVGILDAETGLLWPKKSMKSKQREYFDAFDAAVENTNEALELRMPEGCEFLDYAKRAGNPCRSGTGVRLHDKSLWFVNSGHVDLDEGVIIDGFDGVKCPVLLVSSIFSDKSIIDIVLYCLRNNLNFNSCHPVRRSFFNNKLFAPSLNGISEKFRKIDSSKIPCADLTDDRMKDVHQGLWEFWGEAPKLLKQLGVRARNPSLDVQSSHVAIDFGTSSTVVAYNENGQDKLLRIGAEDLWHEGTSEHYENPTILEFVDFQTMLSEWQAVAYQPAIKWGDIRCSHAALAQLEDNEGDVKVTASLLRKIKQWALRQGHEHQVTITDQINNYEYKLEDLALNNPVKGQLLKVSQDDLFDPIELYAWYLGLVINGRDRGIYLDYSMTFPVDYPKAIKKNILASFRRGLQRSLPNTFVEQKRFSDFRVEERASEPSAFAASAFTSFNIEPTEEGVAYGVFDFGGGTTDFDFGIYRLATEQEEDDEGYEEVFEHFGAGGDNFLGGENILENMSYITFKANLECCRSKKISFTKPLDAESFINSEMFLGKTQASTTNTNLLVARLRSFWEQHEVKNTGLMNLRLINFEGKEEACELVIPYKELQHYIYYRLFDGVRKFYKTLEFAFKEKKNIPKKIHIFLAGNSSQSVFLQYFFGEPLLDVDLVEKEDSEEYLLINGNPIKGVLSDLFGDDKPEFIIHKPVDKDDSDPYQPNAKTGVALGLLHLRPGSPIKIINHAMSSSVCDGEAPFSQYVGRIKRRKFDCSIKKGANYFEWFDLGKPRENRFELIYTTSIDALGNQMAADHSELNQINIDLSDCELNEKVFARIIGPDKINICTAASLEILKEVAGDSELNNYSELSLS